MVVLIDKLRKRARRESSRPETTTVWQAADELTALRRERNAFRTMAINHLWNHNLATAYGREEYQRWLEQQVDETLLNMLAKQGGENG